MLRAHWSCAEGTAAAKGKRLADSGPSTAEIRDAGDAHKTRLAAPRDLPATGGRRGVRRVARGAARAGGLSRAPGRGPARARARARLGGCVQLSVGVHGP